MNSMRQFFHGSSERRNPVREVLQMVFASELLSSESHLVAGFSVGFAMFLFWTTGRWWFCISVLRNSLTRRFG